MTVSEELAEMMQAWRNLKDRQDILDCIQRESRGRDRQDAEQIASCWWPEGVDEHGPMTHYMPAYPESANTGHRANFHMTSHNLTNHLCEIDRDTAYCETYVIGGLRWLHDESISVAFARYLDQLEKREGEWRMLTRRCTMDLTIDGDPSWLHSQATKGFLKPIWGKDDPSYERPIVAKPTSDGVRW